MNLEIIQKKLNELRLHGCAQTLDRRTQEALGQSLHPLEFLQLLLADEQLFRRNSRAKQLTTKARFRSQASLEEWDHEHDRGLSRAKFKELCALGFYQVQENLILVGPTGTGKTHLSIALGRRMCLEGVGAMFFSVNLFFEEVRSHKVAGTYLSFIRKLASLPIIILDDWGLRSYSHEEATILVDLAEDRYRKGSMIISSQIHPVGWVKLFEDPVIAEALTNRLLHPSQTIILQGASYREKGVKNPPCN
jgi:DNA replication protein DnaC